MGEHPAPKSAVERFAVRVLTGTVGCPAGDGCSSNSGRGGCGECRVRGGPAVHGSGGTNREVGFKVIAHAPERFIAVKARFHHLHRKHFYADVAVNILRKGAKKEEKTGNNTKYDLTLCVPNLNVTCPEGKRS